MGSSSTSGASTAEFDAAAQEHGLATTGGRISSIGVAGLTLGGGSGWLERSYGFACDNLMAVELVTAAGDLVRASADENRELFWALRGGGGNFGVATAPGGERTGKRQWCTAEYLDDLNAEALEALVSYGERMPLSFTQLLLLPWGGEIGRVNDSPLAQRQAKWVIHPLCVWEGSERDEEHISWGRACGPLFEPWATGGVYLNYVGDEGEERVQAAFGDSYERLAAVKAEYDPGNFFSGNHNIGVPARVKEATGAAPAAR